LLNYAGGITDIHTLTDGAYEQEHKFFRFPCKKN